MRGLVPPRFFEKRKEVACMPATKENTGNIIRKFFIATCLFLLASILVAPDKDQLISGLLKIWTTPTQLTTDFFAIGGIAATLLNMALTMGLCTVLTFLPGSAPKGVTVAAWLLTMGFTSWGINVVNILPIFFGIFVYSLIKKKPFGSFHDIAMFSTALCPLISELMLRYPNEEVQGFTLLGIVLAVVVAVVIAVLTPAFAAHSPNVHKGFNLYSAALPAGVLGFFFNALLYKTLGNTTPAIKATLHEGAPGFVRGFAVVYFVLCIVAGYFLSGKTFSGYKALVKDTGHKANFVDSYGIGTTIMNIGVYGLLITAYYVLTGAPATGVTLGITFCMVCFGANGSHPLNVWPIMVGYVLASFVGVNPVSAQAIAVGLCYSSGLAPIVGVYGWPFGIIGGIAHYSLVTSVPALHGGFCLYNGGFCSIFIAMLLVPQLEAFCKTKAERKQLKAGK